MNPSSLEFDIHGYFEGWDIEGESAWRRKGRIDPMIWVMEGANLADSQ